MSRHSGSPTPEGYQPTRLSVARHRNLASYRVPYVPLACVKRFGAVTCVIYDPPRKGLPFLVVMLVEGREPIVWPFRSLAEAKRCVKEVSMRVLRGENVADSNFPKR